MGNAPRWQLRWLKWCVNRFTANWKMAQGRNNSIFLCIAWWCPIARLGNMSMEHHPFIDVPIVSHERLGIPCIKWPEDSSARVLWKPPWGCHGSSRKGFSWGMGHPTMHCIPNIMGIAKPLWTWGDDPPETYGRIPHLTRPWHIYKSKYVTI
jgi:hypothetical protein